MLPTPTTSHVSFDRIYEPSEDSYLLLDTLSSPSESTFLTSHFQPSTPAPLLLEVGTGSGVVLAFALAHAQTIFGRTDLAALGTDVNIFACNATAQTATLARQENLKTAGSWLDAVQADLTTPLRPGCVDVLIFNPPYVPTDILPAPEFSAAAGQGDFERDSHLLSLSYAGGKDGMETTDRLLEQIPDVLSPRGVAYVLLCAQNRPEVVMERVRAWEEGRGGWRAEKVGVSGMKAGWEKLIHIHDIPYLTRRSNRRRPCCIPPSGHLTRQAQHLILRSESHTSTPSRNPSILNINMKAGLLTIAALAAGASAHAVGHQHQHQHQHAHRRDENVVYQYEVVTVVAPPPGYQAAAPSAAPGYQPPPAPASNPPSYQPPKQNKPPAHTPPKENKPPAYNPPKPASTSAAPPPPKQDSPTNNNGSTNGLGLTYTPYTSAGGCKSAEQVMADFEKWDGYGLYRIYGVDCDQVCNVIAAVKAKNAKIMLGVFDIANVETEVQTIISDVNGDWSMVDTISIGNELVNKGTAVEAVLAALATARSLLTAAGFTGAIVTVDTFNAVIANPQLCEASDFAAINCHAYFDATGTAGGAGDFVAMQVQRVKEACGGKRVVVTETGWPYQGDANGNAVASIENQAIALASIKSKFTEDCILFSSLSDHWKVNTPATFMCEQYWGIYDHGN
ncbi:unnamed protein product [Zymoseptoria tritici ST99CH_1E4]|uniref:Methyltransferase small domain-containing protein n=2 Tax=Zymoseptoria tritici TaxID=1047171 RepID=A0A2H1H3A6_ZYMTR|nr:unnamed protein product [Zymoseptoria tritici ST99CH_1E4]